MHRVLLMLTLLLAPRAAGAVECEEIGADLQCSACKSFVSAYFQACGRTVFNKKKGGALGGGANAVFNEYKRRLLDIYDVSAPSKKDTVDSFLKRSKGKEHELYLRVCDKYEVVPQPEYDGAPTGEQLEQKMALAEQALEDAVASVKESGTQWAVSGKKGQREFVDFTKAMSSGKMLDNLSMGGDVTEQLMSCYTMLAADHLEDLTSVMTKVTRAYDSGLHKTFCVDVGACPGEKADDEL